VSVQRVAPATTADKTYTCKGGSKRD